MGIDSPDWTQRIITSADNQEQKNGSVSSSDTTLTFSQKVQAWILYNDGPNAIHVNLDAAATTNNFKLPAKAWLMLDVPGTTLHCICASGRSATAYAIGVY